MERTDGERCSRSVLGARNCELHLRDSLFLFLSLFPRITHVKITLERAVRDARRNVGTPAHPSFRQPVIPRRRDRDRRRKRNCKGRRRLPERGERIARVPTRLYRATRLQRNYLYREGGARARSRHRDRPRSSSSIVRLCFQNAPPVSSLDKFDGSNGR